MFGLVSRQKLQIAQMALQEALTQLENTMRERDGAIGERNAYLQQRDEAIGERNEFKRQLGAALHERDELQWALAGRPQHPTPEDARPRAAGAPVRFSS